MGVRALSISVGSFIKWYEEYSDGIVKDAGTGILVQIRGPRPYGNSYKVYRNKFKDFIWVPQTCIEKIEYEDINNRS